MIPVFQMDGIYPYLGPVVGIMVSSVMSSNSSSPNELAQTLVEKVPGFSDAQDLIRKFTGIDILYLALGILLFDAGRRVLRYIFKAVDDFLVTSLMSDICIDANDEIRDEILAWFASRSNKKFGAKSVMVYSGARKQKHLRYPYLREEDSSIGGDEETEINFTPSLGRHYFFPLGWRPFIFEREGKQVTHSRPGWVQQASQDITIRCFGWSDAPLKDFIMLCKALKKQQSKGRTLTYTFSIATFDDPKWGNPYAAPSRSLDTVELDHHIKDGLVKDISRYLDPKTAGFYKDNGIPWRRGYLFHGPPGTGKSSLCRALASHFDLSLYCMNLGEARIDDGDLRLAFSSLPKKCIVLLEDIDSTGIGREKSMKKAESSMPASLGMEDINESSASSTRPKNGVTLSGLLNALDGASASEGRIVIMTSNHPEVLDSALIRPGRIDKRVLLPEMSRTSARRIFKRMYSHSDVEDLEELAEIFASKLPEGQIVPAQLQGFILDHMDDPRKAVNDVEAGPWW